MKTNALELIAKNKLEKKVSANAKQGNVVSLRFKDEDMTFIDHVRGDLLPGEAIKKIIRFLKAIDHDYTKKTIMEAEL